MLTSRQHRPVARPPHRPAQRAQALAQLHNLTLDAHLSAEGGGPQVGRVEGPAHAQVGPEAGLGDQGEGRRGAEIEERGCAAAVEIGEAVGV